MLCCGCGGFCSVFYLFCVIKVVSILGCARLAPDFAVAVAILTVYVVPYRSVRGYAASVSWIANMRDN